MKKLLLKLFVCCQIINVNLASIKSVELGNLPSIDSKNKKNIKKETEIFTINLRDFYMECIEIIELRESETKLLMQESNNIQDRAKKLEAKKIAYEKKAQKLMESKMANQEELMKEAQGLMQEEAELEADYKRFQMMAQQQSMKLEQKCVKILEEAIRKYRAKFFKNPDVISILIPVEMNCGNDESDKTKEILHLSNLEYSKQKVVQDQAKELQKPKKT